MSGFWEGVLLVWFWSGFMAKIGQKMPIMTPKMVEFWNFLWCPRHGHVGPKNQKIWKFFSEILFKKVQGKKNSKKNLTKNLVLILVLKPFDNGIDLRSNLKRTDFIQWLEWNDLTNLTQTSLPYWSEAQEALYRSSLTHDQPSCGMSLLSFYWPSK